MNELENIFENLNLTQFKNLQREAIIFDDNNIEEEMAKQAERYSHFYALLSVGKRSLDSCINELESIKAKRSVEYRDLKKKVSALEMENYLNSHPEIIESKARVADVEFRYSLIKGLVKALEQRKDMLIQCSANKREEARLYTKN